MPLDKKYLEAFDEVFEAEKTTHDPAKTGEDLMTDLTKWTTQFQMEQSAPKLPEKRGLLGRVGGFLAEGKLLEKPAQMLFGTLGETAGRTIVGGAEAAAELVEGAPIPEEERRGYRLGETAPTVGEIGFTALETIPGGVGMRQLLRRVPGGSRLAGAFGEVIGKFSKKQKEKAVKLFTEALAPTTKEMKAKAAKVVPELIERKQVGRLKKLEAVAETKRIEVGTKLDELYEALPADAKLKVEPVINEVTQWQQQYVVKGKIINSKAVKLGDDLKEVFTQFGKEMDVEDMRKVRQILDEEIALGKGFTADVVTKLDTRVKREATDAIRVELAKDYPNIDRFNKEYSFWRNVDDIVGATIKRKAPQRGVIAKGVGKVLGGILGSTIGPKGTMAGMWVGGKLSQVFGSAAWKTRSAIFRNNFADAIVQGDIDKILNTLRILGVVTHNEIRNFKKEHGL